MSRTYGCRAGSKLPVSHNTSCDNISRRWRQPGILRCIEKTLAIPKRIVLLVLQQFHQDVRHVLLALVIGLFSAARA